MRQIQAATKRREWSPERLRKLREKLKMSPEEMGAAVLERTGEVLDGRTIRRWESGSNSPMIGKLQLLARAFNMQLTYFLPFTG